MWQQVHDFGKTKIKSKQLNQHWLSLQRGSIIIPGGLGYFSLFASLYALCVCLVCVCDACGVCICVCVCLVHVVCVCVCVFGACDVCVYVCVSMCLVHVVCV